MVYKVTPVKEKCFVHIPGRWNGECKNELSYTTTQIFFFFVVYYGFVVSVYCVCGGGGRAVCYSQGKAGFSPSGCICFIFLVLPAEIT